MSEQTWGQIPDFAIAVKLTVDRPVPGTMSACMFKEMTLHKILWLL